MEEQYIDENVAVVPALEEEDHKEILKKVTLAVKEAEQILPQKKCIVCGDVATHCMRGLPNNTYCKECAKDHFKFLNYLERL